MDKSVFLHLTTAVLVFMLICVILIIWISLAFIHRSKQRVEYVCNSDCDVYRKLEYLTEEFSFIEYVVIEMNKFVFFRNIPLFSMAIEWNNEIGAMIEKYAEGNNITAERVDQYLKKGRESIRNE